LQDCGVSAFLEAFVLNPSLGIYRNFSAKSPQPRKAPNVISKQRTRELDTNQLKKLYSI